MKCKELFKLIEEKIPLSWQENYDNCGLQIGNPDDEIRGIVYTLDITPEVINKAVSERCNVVISHHPFIFHALKNINLANPNGKIIEKCIREKITIYSAHTNFDKHPAGVSAALANTIGLENPEILSPENGMLKKLVTYCPEAQAESVRNALFSAGAGHIGNYDSCSFNASGLGSFRAGENTNPFVGEKGKIHFEPEIRIETVFPAYKQSAVLSALFAFHPYEEVAFDIYSLDNQYSEFGLGIVGNLHQSMLTEEFISMMKTKLGIQSVRCNANFISAITRVAVCGGSGASFISRAVQTGAQAFVTADLKYHDFQAADGRILLIDAGHFETEIFALSALKSLVSEILPNFAPQIISPDSNWVNTV
ncbi:GTP cyclohydrolase 1 type 2 [anaerobic digester metagenome]